MNLHQLLLVLRSRAWIILAGLGIGIVGAVAANMLLPKHYTATATVVVDTKTTDALTGNMTPAPLIQTQMEIIRSERVALQVVNALKLAESPLARQLFEQKNGGRGSIAHWWAERLQANLDLQNRRDSNLIDIGFTAPDPQFAALVANTFARAYMEITLELTLQPARQTASWFDDQLKDLRTGLEAAQSKLAKTQQKYGIVATEERLDVEYQRLDELASELTAARGDARDGTMRHQRAQEFVRAGRSPDEMPEALASPLLQSLKAELLRGEAKLQETATRLGANHPTFQMQQAEADALRRRLVHEIRTLASSLGTTASLSAERQGKLSRAVEEQKTKLLDLKRQHDDIALLKGEAGSAQKAYDAAMMRYTQTNLASRGSQTNVVVLNPANEPTDASSPKVFRNLLVGIIAGLIVGLNLAVGVEALDRRVRSIDDVQVDLALPVLAAFESSRHSGSAARALEWLRALRGGRVLRHPVFRGG